ncbi:hypothetical protein [Herbiconiux flava]|uniref:Uncharacterized protein n=1 Tax=Herbiconiux flava TaxID=881268 RepID=A0A852ST78_9MICO|nr:hypothetical protein [Herbiconiux flava]NYD72218.1 hypothetical protein [Herbiconiux flava]GLK17817.1 hypothetical protein GCM10017602_22990 [Herbiconiux flava]
MTLTSILPTLRLSIPDPFAIGRWPEWTVPTITDVVVSGVSLRRLVEVCGSPCVHVAAAVVPGTHGRPSDLAQSSVVVATVLAVTGGRLELDADVERVPAVLSEARLIGRASACRTRDLTLPGGAVLALPADLAVGDLVAVPCPGALARRDVLPA